MTWTKLGDEFPDECSALTDAAFRTHVEGLCWVMRRESGGFIADREVRRFAESPDAAAAVEELVAVGWWEPVDGGYVVRHHMEYQPEPDVLEARRRNTRDRVRRHRRKAAGLADEDPDDAARNAVTERVTRDGSGRDGDLALGLPSVLEHQDQEHVCSEAAQESFRARDDEAAEPEPAAAVTLNPKSAAGDGAQPERLPAPDDGFQRFWAAYPRKQHKKPARKAYAEALRDATAEELLAGAVRYRDDPNREDEFTKLPTTWLNAGCWEDDPLPARGGGKPDVMENHRRVMGELAAMRAEGLFGPVAIDNVIDAELLEEEDTA